MIGTITYFEICLTEGGTLIKKENTVLVDMSDVAAI